MMTGEDLPAWLTSEFRAAFYEHLPRHAIRRDYEGMAGAMKQEGVDCSAAQVSAYAQFLRRQAKSIGDNIPIEDDLDSMEDDLESDEDDSLAASEVGSLECEEEEEFAELACRQEEAEAEDGKISKAARRIFDLAVFHEMARGLVGDEARILGPTLNAIYADYERLLRRLIRECIELRQALNCTARYEGNGIGEDIVAAVLTRHGLDGLISQTAYALFNKPSG